MNVDNNSENDGPQSKLRLEHVISFSDAIFAFSITFMAISIQLPNLPANNLTEEQLMSKLLQVGPQWDLCSKFYDYRCLLDFISSCL